MPSVAKEFLMKKAQTPTSEPLSPIASKAAGLYIHIPFCLSKCPYCHFYSETSLSGIPDFLRALFLEMDKVGREWDSFDTVYIGGGTPSVLSPRQIEQVLSAVRNRFSLAPGTEIILEANPADLTLPYLCSLREVGIKNLNLGIQSFDQKSLNFLGRRHSLEQAISAIENSRRAGFEHIGLDLIYGIPGQPLKSWLDTVSRALAFSPEHISCYQLTVERDTPLGTAHHKGEISLPPEEDLYAFFVATAGKLEDAGYIHYEVSNFAREHRYASRHNQKYWDHTPYLGLGPAAHSFSGRRRWWNYRSLSRFISALKAGELPIQGSETLSRGQLQLEALFLGLRTKKGIDIEEFWKKYQYDLLSKKEKVVSKLREDGFLSLKNGRLQPIRAGLAVADTLALI